MWGSSIGLAGSFAGSIAGSFGNDAVDPPVIAVDDVRAGRPYAWRRSAPGRRRLRRLPDMSVLPPCRPARPFDGRRLPTRSLNGRARTGGPLSVPCRPPCQSVGSSSCRSSSNFTTSLTNAAGRPSPTP